MWICLGFPFVLKCIVIFLSMFPFWTSVLLSADGQEHPVHADPVEPGPLPWSRAGHILAAGTCYAAGTHTDTSYMSSPCLWLFLWRDPPPATLDVCSAVDADCSSSFSSPLQLLLLQHLVWILGLKPGVGGALKPGRAAEGPSTVSLPSFFNPLNVRFLVSQRLEAIIELAAAIAFI